MTETGPPVHTMIRRATDSSGAQDWWCEQCGRRFILRFPPNYSKVVLEQGDLTAQHVSGTGGLEMLSLGLVDQPGTRWTDDTDAELARLLDGQDDGPAST